MVYQLGELLVKMGVPQADMRERSHVEWHYFDTEKIDLAGFAEVRLEAGGARLVAELRHTRQDYEDDHGTLHAQFEQTFYMVAEKTSAGLYEIRSMGFDGTDYSAPAKAIAELGLSLFHARALDISIRMVECAFNKNDVFEVPEHVVHAAQKAIFAKAPALSRETFGQVIPFRQREVA